MEDQCQTIQIASLLIRISDIISSKINGKQLKYIFILLERTLTKMCIEPMLGLLPHFVCGGLDFSITVFFSLIILIV